MEDGVKDVRVDRFRLLSLEILAEVHPVSTGNSGRKQLDDAPTPLYLKDAFDVT